MEEYMSLTHSSSGHYSITYDKYFTMLQNACIRYHNSLKQKPSMTSRAVYQHDLDEDPSVQEEEDDYADDNFAPDGIDTPSDDFYNVHATNLNGNPQVKSLIFRTPHCKPKYKKTVPNKPRNNGPVYLPKNIYTMLSEEVEQELDKYNQEKKASYKSAHLTEKYP